MQQDADFLIEKFLNNTLDAISLLYKNNLIGQMLVVVYSAIDSMGLLDAQPHQTSATGESFKNWVIKYILPHGHFDFNEVDFWAARCSVLHTFTSESDLSSKGRARQIQYYAGSKETEMAKAFVTATKEIDNGAHVPAHIEETYIAFLKGIKQFSVDLSNNCKTDPAYETRLRKILQKFTI
jgi:hypothetical protein